LLVSAEITESHNQFDTLARLFIERKLII